MIYVYKVTNKINNKFYIGVHKGKIDDGYLGSGVLISKAVKKYGSQNFVKEIIKICDTKEEAYLLERELVTPEMVSSKVSYNLTTGGRGGFYHIDVSGDKSPMKRQEVKDKVRAAIRNNTEAMKKLSETGKNNIKFAHKANIGREWTPEHKANNRAANIGRKHSEESKLKMSISGRSKPQCSNETRLKRSINAKNANRDMGALSRGCKRSDEFKQNQSKIMIEKFKNSTEIYKCEYCDVESKLKTNIVRWHNENCKHKNGQK